MKNRAAFELSGVPLAVGGIEHALGSDLKQQRAAVMRILLHHPRRRAGDPDIAVGVEGAAVKPRVQQLRVSPRIDQRAVCIELDDRRRQAPGIQVAFENSIQRCLHVRVARPDKVAAHIRTNPSGRPPLCSWSSSWQQASSV
jgi:hypothetical protein